MGRQRLGRGVFATWEILPQPTHTPRCRRSSSHPRCWLLRWLTSADLHIVIIVWNSEELWKTNEPGDHTRVLDVGCNFAMRDGRLGMQNGKERMNNRFSEGDASIRPHSWAGGRRARALTGSARRFLRSPAYACPVAGKQFARSYGWGSAKESTSAALATRNRPLLGKFHLHHGPPSTGDILLASLHLDVSSCPTHPHWRSAQHTPLPPLAPNMVPTVVHRCLCRPTVADRCLPSRDRPLRDRFVMAGGRRDELTSAPL